MARPPLEYEYEQSAAQFYLRQNLICVRQLAQNTNRLYECKHAMGFFNTFAMEIIHSGYDIPHSS